jgi:cyclic beta-1,2-glucan synthetase
VIESFAPFIDKREPDVVSAWRGRAAMLRDAVEFFAWDGDWYLRGFFDSGAPLGSHANSEARIDSIAQSWAAMAKGPLERVRRAMESADRILADDVNHLVRLFTPPFNHSTPHPGYIMGYPPGLRENGGQYTHGSLWMAMAWARLGEGGAAVRLLTMMNPAEHSRNLADAARYRGEPYIAAADVSTAAGREGQAGWTWYTGSAGVMYRAWIEDVLGFYLRGDLLTLKPALPEDWPGFEITYRYRSSVYQIAILTDPSIAATTMSVDGGAMTIRDTLQLYDDGGTHRVDVRIPGKVQPTRPVEAPGLIDASTQADQPVVLGRR